MTFVRAAALGSAALLSLAVGLPAQAAPQRARTVSPADQAPPPAKAPEQAGIFTPDSVESEGSVSVGGQRIDYRAVAGTLVVHPKGYDDAASLE
jgi:hypothetical protein